MIAAPSSAAKLGATFAALYAAHQVADHWVQTDHQAANKGKPGAAGWSANLAHVASYTATAALALAVASNRCDLRLTPGRVAAGLAFSAVTHSWADRRHTLSWLADRLETSTGKSRFYGLGACRPGKDDNPHIGTGSYALDQSFHVGALFVAALIAAGGRQ
jgi:hypothetical protein